ILRLGGAFLWARPPPNSETRRWAPSGRGRPASPVRGVPFFCFMTVSRETPNLNGWCYSPIGARVFPVVQHRLAGKDKPAVDFVAGHGPAVAIEAGDNGPFELMIQRQGPLAVAGMVGEQGERQLRPA